ncbi:MAG TPA: PEP-CTERM sorting domain-containing protein [Tepidisphaeraceae bacterium]|jgi:hypothetical protein
MRPQRKLTVLRRALQVSALAVPVLCVSQMSSAAAFTPGNIVVTRAVGGDVDTSGGGGSAGAITTPFALGGSGVAATVFLDEYTPLGGFVQSVQLPNVRNTSGTGNRALTFSGTQNTEGAITLSGDGRFFVIAGYNATGCGTTSSANFLATSNGASTAVERVVGLVGVDGSINTTTALTDVSSGQAFRSAYSSNGTDIWASGGSGSGTTSGIHYATVGSSTSTQLVAGVTNHRVLNAFNGSLYVSNNSQTVATRGPNQMSGGLATSGAQTLTQLPGFNVVAAPTPTGQNTDDFWFKDPNTLYIADERNGATGSGNGDGANGGVQKWIIGDIDPDPVNVTLGWIFQYNVPLGLSAGPANPTNNVGGHGLAGTIDPTTGNAILYVTSFDGGGPNRNKLFKLVDDGTAAGFAASLTTLATAPDNGGFATAFRGVEIVPVPEPTAMALLALSTVGLIRRRSSR